MVTQFSKDEYIHMVKTMKDDPSLANFRSRVANARTIYKKICEAGTAKQAIYAGKPFFY
jgi:hypothetical protein